MFSCSVRAPRLLAVASILLAGVGVACNDTSVSPTDVLRAVISVNTNPNPVTALASTRLGTTFSAQFKVEVKESAGQGGELQAVNSTLYDDLTGLIIGVVNYDTADLLVFVGQKRIEANGTFEVPIQIDYVIPSDVTAKAARLQVLVNFKDDRGNTVSSSVLVKVQ
jgi:hypothetical protein